MTSIRILSVLRAQYQIRYKRLPDSKNDAFHFHVKYFVIDRQTFSDVKICCLV